LEVLPERGLFGGVSLQGTIFRFDACYLARLNLEDMGAGEMQAFRVLVIKNRQWTADRLAARGWDHNPVCLLCRTQPETAHHLLVECRRYSRRIWAAVASWTGYDSAKPSGWAQTSPCFMGDLAGKER